jgi:hypothetical protein
VGSSGIGAIVAQIAFWLILIRGAVGGELGLTRAATLIGLWAAGCLGLPHVSTFGSLFVPSYVAVLDIVLVFIVFKGDVRLS